MTNRLSCCRLIKNFNSAKFGAICLVAILYILCQIFASLRVVSRDWKASIHVDIPSDNFVIDVSRKDFVPSKVENEKLVVSNVLHNLVTTYLPVQVDHKSVITPAKVHQAIVYEEKEFLKLVKNREHGTTVEPNQNDQNLKIRLENENKTVEVTIDEYKSIKARQFIDDVNGSIKKTKPGKPNDLIEYTDEIARPNPRLMIKDTTMYINHDAILQELNEDKKRRSLLNDDDLTEVVQDITTHDILKIPNIIHFIWFGCRPFKIHHYISMLSAYKRQNPDAIIFHTNCKPDGYLWTNFENAADLRLIIVRRSPPTSIFGKKVEKVEHQSDVARLQILLEVGGIYMDDDVIILKSLDPLRNNDFVIGEENYDALANSIILANKDAWFLRRWFWEYRTFNDTRWSDSSCFVPWSLWQLFPDSGETVVKETLLRPNWEEVHLLYQQVWDWTNNYSIHLYSRFMPSVDGKSERTIEELAVLNTTYGEIARYTIWDDPKIQNISEWIF